MLVIQDLSVFSRLTALHAMADKCLKSRLALQKWQTCFCLHVLCIFSGYLRKFIIQWTHVQNIPYLHL